MPDAAETPSADTAPPAPQNNNRRNFRHNRRSRNPAPTKFRSTVPGLEDDVFDIGASANPASFNQVMEKIGLYIQKNYKDPNEIVLAIRNRSRPNLSPPARPVKGTQSDAEFALDVFDYQEERKSIAEHLIICDLESPLISYSIIQKKLQLDQWKVCLHISLWQKYSPKSLIVRVGRPMHSLLLFNINFFPSAR